VAGKGANPNAPLTNGIEVADGATVKFELFGRLFSDASTLFGDEIVTVEALSDVQMNKIHLEAGVDYTAAETHGNKAYIFAELSPKFNLAVDDAAKLAGYNSFNWVQVVRSESSSRLKVNYPNEPYPLTDPPAGQTLDSRHKPKDDFPYYLDMEDVGSLYVNGPLSNLNGNFNVRDRPEAIRKFKNGKIEFTTHLVGVSNDDRYLSESLYNFDWSSDFYGVTSKVTFTDWSHGAILKPDDIKVVSTSKNPLHHSEFYGNDIDKETGLFKTVSPKTGATTPVPSTPTVETPEPVKYVMSDPLVLGDTAPEPIDSEYDMSEPLVLGDIESESSESDLIEYDSLLNANRNSSSEFLYERNVANSDLGSDSFYQVNTVLNSGSESLETLSQQHAGFGDRAVFDSSEPSLFPTDSTIEF